MYKVLLSSALGAIFLAGVYTEPLVSVTSAAPASAAAPGRQGEGSVYKFSDGGIQFTVPAGWEVKPDKDSVKVFPDNHNAQIAFVALPIPANLAPEERASLFDSLSEKAGITDMTLDEYVDSETLGGMKVASRFYKGKNSGHDVAGVFFLLSAEKLVFITVVTAKSQGETYERLEAVINSIKKIE